MGADRPAHVAGVSVELAGVADRNNVNALYLARRFDDPAQRVDDIARFAAAVKRTAGGRPGRVAVPAIFGLAQHAEAWAELRARLPLEPFEVPLVPPSIPGMRLWRVLRERIRAAGGRVQIGEAVARIHVEGGRVTAVEMEAATRTHLIRTEALVLATGGIAGGGLVATRRRPDRRAAARPARGRAGARQLARRRCARPGRPPDRGRRHRHRRRPPAARPRRPARGPRERPGRGGAPRRSAVDPRALRGRRGGRVRVARRERAGRGCDQDPDRNASRSL